MEDYKEEIKRLFLKYYTTQGEDFQKQYISTLEVLSMFRGIIPNEPIGEHDIFEVLKEMGFGQELQILYEKICIYEGDEEMGIPAEYEMRETGSVFKWVIYKNE